MGARTSSPTFCACAIVFSYTIWTPPNGWDWMATSHCHNLSEQSAVSRRKQHSSNVFAHHLWKILWTLFGEPLWKISLRTLFEDSRYELCELSFKSLFENYLWQLTLAILFRSSRWELCSGTFFCSNSRLCHVEIHFGFPSRARSNLLRVSFGFPFDLSLGFTSICLRFHFRIRFAITLMSLSNSRRFHVDSTFESTSISL